jgi:hypothetical protein
VEDPTLHGPERVCVECGGFIDGDDESEGMESATAEFEFQFADVYEFGVVGEIFESI